MVSGAAITKACADVLQVWTDRCRNPRSDLLRARPHPTIRL